MLVKVGLARSGLFFCCNIFFQKSQNLLSKGLWLFCMMLIQIRFDCRHRNYSFSSLAYWNFLLFKSHCVEDLKRINPRSCSQVKTAQDPQEFCTVFHRM